MSLLWLLGALVSISAVSVIWIHRRRLQQASDHDIDMVTADLRMLLKRGYDGAVMTLKDVVVKRSVHFRKYITESGEFGLEMKISGASLSDRQHSEFNRVLVRASQPGKAPLVLKRDSADALVLDFGQDIETATGVVSAMFTNVFGSAQFRVRVWADGICPLDQLVSRRDHPRPKEMLGAALKRKRCDP